LKFNYRFIPLTRALSPRRGNQEIPPGPPFLKGGNLGYEKEKEGVLAYRVLENVTKVKKEMQ
jgi:hypothetical protein